MFCKQVPVLGRIGRRELSLRLVSSFFGGSVQCGKHDLGEDGKTWAGFADRDSVREVTPKQDTWADFEAGRLNPAASWPWEPHRGSPANPDVLVSDERRLDRNKLVALKKQ